MARPSVKGKKKITKRAEAAGQAIADSVDVVAPGAAFPGTQSFGVSDVAAGFPVSAPAPGASIPQETPPVGASGAAVGGSVPGGFASSAAAFDGLMPSDTFDLGETAPEKPSGPARPSARERGRAVKRARALRKAAQAGGSSADAAAASPADPRPHDSAAPSPARPSVGSRSVARTPLKPSSEQSGEIPPAYSGASDSQTSGSAAGAPSSTSRNAADVRRAAATRKRAAWAKGKAPLVRKVVLAVLAVAAVVAVAAGAYFAWDTFFRYDDAADIQGEWKTAGGTMTVVITADSINMPDGLSYAYTMDTAEKTISFSFADLAGGGAYEFSEDRATLSISEGDSAAPAATVLVKVSGDTQAEPQMLPAEAAGDQEASGDGAAPEPAGESEGEGEGASDAQAQPEAAAS